MSAGNISSAADESDVNRRTYEANTYAEEDSELKMYTYESLFGDEMHVMRRESRERCKKRTAQVNGLFNIAQQVLR